MIWNRENYCGLSFKIRYRIQITHRLHQHVKSPSKQKFVDRTDSGINCSNPVDLGCVNLWENCYMIYGHIRVNVWQLTNIKC